MANRLVSNVYIIDSQLSATVPLPWGDPNNISKMRIISIGFYSLDTTAKMQICLNNSSHTVAQFGWIGSATTVNQQMQSINFGGPGVEWQQVFVPLLTAGTGYLYLI